MRMLAVGCGLALLGCNVCAWAQAKTTTSEEGAEILTMVLVIQDSSEFHIPIPLRPVRSVRIVAPVAGHVERLEVSIGDEVQRQGVVARMDSRRETIRLEAAREKLQLLERAGSTASSTILVDLKTQVRLAELELEQTRAYAPFAGKVHEVFVTEGQFVLAGDPLVLLSDNSGLSAMVPVRRGDHQKGGTISLQVEGQNVAGKIVEILPLSGRMEKLYELGGALAQAYVIVPNPQGTLKAGQLVRSPLIPEEPITRAPTAAIQVAGGQTFLRVLRNGVVRYIDVLVLGEVGKSGSRVSGEVLPGDEVIVKGPESLAEGMVIGAPPEGAEPKSEPGRRAPAGKATAPATKPRRLM